MYLGQRESKGKGEETDTNMVGNTAKWRESPEYEL